MRFPAAHSSSPRCKGGWGTPMGGRWGKGAEAISGIPGASRATSWACLDSHLLSNTRDGWCLPAAAQSQTQGLQKGQSSPWTQSTDRATAGQEKPEPEKMHLGSYLGLQQCLSITVACASLLLTFIDNFQNRALPFLDYM